MQRIKLPAGEADLAPSNHWPEPLVAAEVANDRGPVLILIEYRVPADRSRGFLRAINALSVERRRDGAYGWGITEDTADPEGLVEWSMVSVLGRASSPAPPGVQVRCRCAKRGRGASDVGKEGPVVRHFLHIHPLPGLAGAGREPRREWRRAIASPAGLWLASARGEDPGKKRRPCRSRRLTRSCSRTRTIPISPILMCRRDSQPPCASERQFPPRICKLRCRASRGN